MDVGLKDPVVVTELVELDTIFATRLIEYCCPALRPLIVYALGPPVPVTGCPLTENLYPLMVPDVVGGVKLKVIDDASDDIKVIAFGSATS
jgi:hypothetical protein